jgi:hypothetical protein
MARDIPSLAEEGLEACARGDRTRAVVLVTELIEAVDFEHPAAGPVCRLYDEALTELAAGGFGAARRPFQALRAV